MSETKKPTLYDPNAERKKQQGRELTETPPAGLQVASTAAIDYLEGETAAHAAIVSPTDTIPDHQRAAIPVFRDFAAMSPDMQHQIIKQTQQILEERDALVDTDESPPFST